MGGISQLDIEDVLSYGSCVSIMAFNSFQGQGSIVASDLHHPYENIIGFQQIFELGQKAFEEYIPVAGMYSVLHGLYLNFFGNNQITYYSIATNIMYLCVILLIQFLLRGWLKGGWLLLVTIMFYTIDYDRVILILPIVLLLSHPWLLKRKNMWLKAWFLSSFIHGLYYPVYGAAVCLGFLPLGLWQIYSYVQSSELRRDIGKIKFWVWWLICLIPALAGIKLLLGTMRHMRAMAAQTVYADGMSRFSQKIPDGFFTYIDNEWARRILFYIFAYMILISIVWIAFAVFLGVLVGVKKGEVKVENSIVGFLSIAICIMMLVSFSYTLVRLDVEDLYARNKGVVFAVFVILILILSKYMHNVGRNGLWLLTFTIFIISVVNGEGFSLIESSSKLNSSYIVPDGYVYFNDDNRFEKLGRCYVDEDIAADIESIYNAAENLDRDNSYIGGFIFSGYYFTNLKGAGTIELDSVKSYDATKELVDIMKSDGAIVHSFLLPYQYYLYNWLMTRGYYVWNDEMHYFEPNNGYTYEEVIERNKKCTFTANVYDLEWVSNSWGKSMESLEGIFDDNNISYNLVPSEMNTNIVFDHDISSDEVDFLYIEFEGLDNDYDYLELLQGGEREVKIENSFWADALMKKNYNPGMSVSIAWEDDEGIPYNFNSFMGEGKLLIPLGAGKGWLLNNHSYVKIVSFDNDEIITTPAIKEVKLLKLREVE